MPTSKAAPVRCGERLGEGLGLQWADIDFDRGTLQVGRAVQRFGGSASARKPLLAERKALLKALGTEQALQGETAIGLRTELKRVREALKGVKTAVQVVEPKSSRSRRTIALPAIVVKALNRCQGSAARSANGCRETLARFRVRLHDAHRHTTRSEKFTLPTQRWTASASVEWLLVP
jgi:integrase